MNRKYPRAPIFIFVFILSVFFIFLSSTQIFAETIPWLESDIQTMIQSDWFNTFGYGDCQSGPWPYNFWDCIIPDDNIGPSDFNSTRFPDPPGLYYKHLTPSLLSNSGESLVVGLQGSLGEVTWSLSLMVHPKSELPILGSVSPTERVEELYLPYILGATGLTTTTIKTNEIVDLYLAAVYTCDRTSSDQTGLGLFKEWGNYVAVVQRWDMHEDCNIHVFNTTSEPPTPSDTPPPSETPTPTGTSTPTDTLIPSITPTPSDTPTETTIPTDTPLPTDTLTPDVVPPVLSNITAGDLTGTSASIDWDTDEPADSRVEYGYEKKTGLYSYNQSSILDPALVINHKVSLTNLKVEKVYHFRVYSTDSAGNTVISGDNVFISTPGSNSTPTATPNEPSQTPTDTDTPSPTPTNTPVTPTVEPTPGSFTISNVVVQVLSTTTALITWETDVDSDSLVEGGLARNPGVILFSENDASQVTSHSILVTGLKKNNTYYFYVISTDAYSNTIISDEFTFTTPLKD